MFPKLGFSLLSRQSKKNMLGITFRIPKKLLQKFQDYRITGKCIFEVMETEKWKFFCNDEILDRSEK